ncbi:MAG: hypothetical protein AB1589_39380 [Cyanobacteriota bacterium]
MNLFDAFVRSLYGSIGSILRLLGIAAKSAYGCMSVSLPNDESNRIERKHGWRRS